MKKLNYLLFCLLLQFMIIGCVLPFKRGDSYEYIPIEEYHFRKLNLEEGTKLRLLAFSGGPENDASHTYFYQFITKNESTGDTIRILTPLICIDPPAGLKAKISTTPLQYDYHKGITEASFETYDSAKHLSDQIFSQFEEDPSDSAAQNLLNRDLNTPGYVVVNKSISLFTRNFKTAVGAINFKQPPW